MHGDTSHIQNVTLRRYAGMALTNLTFGDGTNKALLCGMKMFMHALVAQLCSPNEDLRQVTASVLRNLTWRADLSSKKTLREVNSVSTLMKVAIEAEKESTLKSTLSALWNLTAHCSMNKADICAVEDALAFLVKTLVYKSPSKTLVVIENCGGILRNISSHIAVYEEYRQILRQHNCLQKLLQHLKSPSLTIVSNACGTLWNLSARSAIDQNALLGMGAVSMLRNLVHSKHKMISMGSSAALKNLLASKPAGSAMSVDPSNKSNMPSLHVRKQKALEAELDQNLAETCENIESPKSSPTTKSDDEQKFNFKAENNCHTRRLLDRQMVSDRMSHSVGPVTHLSLSTAGLRVPRSSSRDSIESGRSDVSHDRHRSIELLSRSSKLLSGENRRRPSASPARHAFGASQQDPNNSSNNEGTDFDAASSTKLDGRGFRCNSMDRKLIKRSDMHNLSLLAKTRDFSGSDDQPIDYTLKYRSEKKNVDSKWKGQSSSTPKPKINNYMASFDPSNVSNSDGSSVNTYHRSGFNHSSNSPTFPLQYRENDSTTVDNDQFFGFCAKDDESETPLTAATSLSDLVGNEDDSNVGTLGVNNNSDKSAKNAEESFAENKNDEVQLCGDETKLYYVEDTPACFSRVSSLSSIENDSVRSNDVPCPLRITENVEDHSVAISAETKLGSKDESTHPTEAISTTGRRIDCVDSVEQTPMMFSRTSSLESVDSCEQHSIHDDRSSVVTDFRYSLISFLYNINIM